MGVERTIDITAEECEVVLALVQRHLPGIEAWVYGSRAKWTSRPQSDLDLVVFATPAQSRKISDLREAFEESNLPFRVDLFVWSEVPEQFHQEIERDHVVLVSEGECNHSKLKWPVSTIEEVSEKVAMGPFGSAIKVETFVPDGVPIISGKHLHGAKVDDTSGFNFITEEHAQQLANANVRRGDVVFTHAGNIGQVAYIPEHSEFSRYVISQRQFYMRCNRSKVIPEFLTAYFRSHEGKHKLLANTSQVGVPSIAQPVTYLRTIEIPVPPLPEQRAIAHILGTLDDKIELNRRMNETLEAMARALFKSWFVDFDPVRAKMTLKHSPSRESAWTVERARAYLDRMDPKIADLFPDRLIDSELGEIPEGWKKDSLGNLFDVTIGRTPPRKESHHFVASGQGRTWLSIKRMGELQTYAFSSEEDLTSEAVKQYRVPFVPSGTVLVSFKLTVGRVAIASGSMHTNEAIAHLIAKDDTPVSNVFTYCFMKNFDFESLGSTSSIATAVNSRSIKGIEMILPQDKIHAAFVKTTQSAFARILSGVRQNEVLATIRDTLLPRLISGEMRVDDKVAVEAAV